MNVILKSLEEIGKNLPDPDGLRSKITDLCKEANKNSSNQDSGLGDLYIFPNVLDSEHQRRCQLMQNYLMNESVRRLFEIYQKNPMDLEICGIHLAIVRGKEVIDLIQ